MTPDDLIYLAYPIDQVEPETADGSRLTSWVRHARYCLDQRQQPYYDPGAALTNWPGRRAAGATQAINNIALGRASGVLALLPPGIASIGTPMEIERAWHNSKPVAILHQGEPSPLFARTGAATFSIDTDSTWTIGAAVDWLLGQDNGLLQNRDRLLAVRRLDDGGQLPVRMFDHDAGFDLMVSQDTVIPPGQFADVPCGIAVELPPSTWGLIIGRSSTLRKRNLLVTPAVIDGGYRGPLFAGCYNLNPARVVDRQLAGQTRIEAGDRLAQFIPFHNVAATLTPGWVAELTPSDRGERGFGSSGA